MLLIISMKIYNMPRAAHGRVAAASQTHDLPLMKPLQKFMNHANPDYTRPDPFFCGLYTSHPPTPKLHQLVAT